ncbi:MAG: ribbon-helix-helix protein, CopG family [Proteobacteria bacterium]|nr:ribbon-helix-helix protein, CopG family [Pseudomonadota bacterium]
MNKEIRKQVKALEKLRLPELRARYAEVLGEETRAPNRTYLIRRITEALEACAAEAPEQNPAEPQEAPVETAQHTEETAAASVDTSDATELSKLPIAELQARYLEVVQRPTSSEHRRYLIWKIREAQKGRIPVGPRGSRRADGEALDFKVLPLRMEADLVAKLDEARERLGLKSRMELLRRSIHLFLAREGEAEVAALFAPEA